MWPLFTYINYIPYTQKVTKLTFNYIRYVPMGRLHIFNNLMQSL